MRIKIIVISFLLASCSSLSMPRFSMLEPHKIDIQQGNLITPEMREKVKLGMSAAMVRSILGTPLITDPFHAKRWDYVYCLEKGGKQVERQRLTLYLEDDHLARIDDSNMPALTAATPSINKN
jgi:outer membrane protein assembly factor BamE